MFDLRLQMEATGLYSDNDPVSRGELRAYERQLNDFLAWQQQMKREMALDTTELLIERWEKIYDEHPELDDTIRDRQLRLLNKRRARGVLTPAKVIAFAKDHGFQATIKKRIRPFCYLVRLNTIDANLMSLETALLKAEPSHQKHEYELGAQSEALVISDRVVAKLQRYHKIQELKVGMTLIKNQSEVEI